MTEENNYLKIEKQKKRPDDDDTVPPRRNTVTPGTPVDQLGSGYPEINPLGDPLEDVNGKPTLPAADPAEKKQLWKKGESGNLKGRPKGHQQPITKKMLRASQKVIIEALTSNDVRMSERLKAAFYVQDRVFGKATQNLNVQNESQETYAEAMAELGSAISESAQVRYMELEQKRLENRDKELIVDVEPTEVKEK